MKGKPESGAFFGGGPISASERAWAERAVKSGLLTPVQVRKALVAREESDPKAPLEVVLVSLGYLQEPDVDELCRTTRRIPKLSAPKPKEAEEIVAIYGSCTVLEPVGRGPCGSVYIAMHGDTGARLALKVISPNALNRPFFPRFMGSVRLSLGLRHPASARVVDAGIQDGALYVASQFQQGIPLAEFVRSNGPLAPVQASTVLVQAAGALQEAHAAGLVHGNLKPENLFITGRMEIRITDYGLGRADSAFLKDHADKAGSIVYSLAPEQWSRESVPASDLYALGVLWHFMLTGRFPFESRWFQDIREKHENADPPEPPGADPALYARLLAKDPAARPSPREMAEALAPVRRARKAARRGR